MPDLVGSRLTQEVPFSRINLCHWENLSVESGTFPMDILPACGSALCEVQSIDFNHTTQVFRAYTLNVIAMGKLSLYMNQNGAWVRQSAVAMLAIAAVLYCTVLSIFSSKT